MADAQITVFIGASARRNRFAISDAVGRPAWARTFRRGDGFTGNQASADAAALNIALKLAKALRRALAADHIYLTVHTSAGWLAAAMKNPKSQSKTAHQARQFATENKITIIANETPRDLNPADREANDFATIRPQIETPQTLQLATKAANNAQRIATREKLSKYK